MASPPPAPPASTVADLRHFVEAAHHLVVLTGAGVSTESGIPDYRDENGDWKRRPPVQYLDFVRHPRVRERYWARSMLGWATMADAKPGPAHRALARLESAGIVRHVVTQNVDGLHQKAGSQRVTDLHGRLADVACLSCGTRRSRASLQRELEARNPAWAAQTAPTAPDGDADADAEPEPGTLSVPDCAVCGGLLKPCVVFFGESVPAETTEEAYARVDEADALLIVGSSLMVFSGYRFVRAAVRDGKPVAAVNLGRTRADDDLVLRVPLRCGEVLPELLLQLGIVEA